MVIWPILVMLAALAVAIPAEWLHARRLRRAGRLAFGPTGQPAAWAQAAPYLRCVAVTMVAWGATELALYDPVQEYNKPLRKASKHLLVCLDVSPSMTLPDAGPGPEKLTRGVWAGKVVQGVLDRLDAETTRVTLVAFYTDALPIVQETFDKEVISNALDGLPMWIAFEPGATDVYKGVAKAMEYARTWPAKSALLLVVSDGDSANSLATIRKPDSIADTIVIGVGDALRSSVIHGHGSRQDTDSLKQLAARLGGVYHNGNEKHLPSEMLDKLSVTSPAGSERVSVREVALAAASAGAVVLALLEPLLILLGRPGAYRRARKMAMREGPMARPATPPAVQEVRS
jgi:Ca-activated chloride channel family protein